MYACIRETGAGFFGGVCRQENRPPTFRDPPPLTPQFVNRLWEIHLAAHPSEFMQDRGYGLSRMHLPRRLVNKSAVNAPASSEWHHAHGANCWSKTRVGNDGSIRPPKMGATLDEPPVRRLPGASVLLLRQILVRFRSPL
jgi:hypothetical protein